MKYFVAGDSFAILKIVWSWKLPTVYFENPQLSHLGNNGHFEIIKLLLAKHSNQSSLLKEILRPFPYGGEIYSRGIGLNLEYTVLTSRAFLTPLVV